MLAPSYGQVIMTPYCVSLLGMTNYTYSKFFHSLAIREDGQIFHVTFGSAP